MIIIPAALCIYSLIKYNPQNLSSYFQVGNAWIRLFGILIMTILSLLFITLMTEIYKLLNNKLKYIISGALVSLCIMLIAVSTIIYSGAARLDSDFTLDKEVYVSHEIEEEYIHTSDEASFADENMSFAITRCYINRNSHLISIRVAVNNHSNQTIQVKDIRYSISTDEGLIYSAEANMNDSALEEISEVGQHTGNFNVYIPLSHFDNNVEVTLSYYDENHNIHYLSDKTTITN